MLFLSLKVLLSKKWEHSILREMGLFSLKKKRLREDLSKVYKYLMAGSKENRAALFSRHPGQDERQWDINWNTRNCEDGQALAQVAHISCGISHPWRYSHPNWMQWREMFCAVAGEVWEEGLGCDWTSRGPFSLCDCLIWSLVGFLLSQNYFSCN